MPRRRLIHFQSPNPQTLQDLRDKSKLMAPGGVDVDVQYCPVAELDKAEGSEEGEGSGGGGVRVL